MATVKLFLKKRLASFRMGGGSSKEGEDPEPRGSDAADEIILCDICNEKNKTVEPEGFCVDCSDYLCRECLKDHPKIRASRNHILKDKATMPKQRPKAEDLGIDKCGIHSNETIKFYCKAHKKLGCGSCMITNHRQCEGVENIADLSQGLKGCQDYQQCTRKLNFLQERSQNLITSSSGKMSKAEACCSEAVKSVKQLRADLGILLAKLETAMCREAEAMKSKDAAKLSAVSDEAIKVLGEVQKASSGLLGLIDENQSSQAFIMMIKTRDKLQHWSETLDKEESKNTVQTYTFKTTPEIQQVLEKQVFPGKIEVNKH